MIGKVALFLDVYPEYKCETYRFRFPESENTKMKKKKKLSLAGQIFIALILAIIAGLLMQSHAEFAETIWYDLSELAEVYCCTDCPFLYYERYHLHE